MSRCHRRAARHLAVAVAVVLALGTSASAFDRTDVPLKNWGGFALYHDAVYDDLERLVMAGLADRVLLDTKPLSRIEAARIVARAIVKIRNDTTGVYNDRQDLEDVLDRLIEEFKVELTSLGVQLPGKTVPAPGFASVTPVDRAQVFGGYANQHVLLVNSQGAAYKRGVNGGMTFESRAQVGDLLSFYLQPELLENEDYGAARLATGYAKLTLFNVELAIGRESLDWGPGYHNALILSNNAAPLDQIRLGTAEPFLPPWIGRWTGPTKFTIFVAQLEHHRDHPFAKLSGMRLAVAPRASFELGFNYTKMWDGLHPTLPLSQYPSAVFNPGYGNSTTKPANTLMGFDGSYRISNVNRFLLPARDVNLYGEFYWDDTCGECISSGIGHFFASNFLPKGTAVGAVGGIHVVGLFGQDWLESRVEYARTGSLSLNHYLFLSGYWTRGHVLSDFIGTEGQDYYARLTARVRPTFMIGVEVDRALIGRTSQTFEPQERRVGGGIDVSYRFGGTYSLFAQYLGSDVRNRHFTAGDNGFDHVVRVELTRSFR